MFNMKGMFLCVLASLTTHVVSQDFQVFHTVSSKGDPGNFTDGLFTYLPARAKVGFEQFTTEYLLCSSCTVSYIFGSLDGLPNTDTSTPVTFRTSQTPIPVYFQSVELTLDVWSGAGDDATKESTTVTS